MVMGIQDKAAAYREGLQYGELGVGGEAPEILQTSQHPGAKPALKLVVNSQRTCF